MIGFGVRLSVRARGVFVVPPLHSSLPPLIATQVDQHTHQPRLLSVRTRRHGPRRTRHPQEGLLHKVERVVGTRRQSPREAVQTLVMSIEECRDPIGGPVFDRDSEGTNERVAAHTYLDV